MVYNFELILCFGFYSERKQYPVHISPSNSSFCSDDTDDEKSELLHPSSSSHTETPFQK